MKLFFFSTLLAAAQANFFRHHRGRNGFLGAGIRHSGANFHTVISLANTDDFNTTNITYYNCGSTTTNACKTATENSVQKTNLGVTTSCGTTCNRGDIKWSLDTIDGLNLYNIEYIPNTTANHILMEINSGGQTVLEEYYHCNPGYEITATGVCTSCPAGQYAVLGATTCTPCPTGTYSTSGAAACTQCPGNSVFTGTGGTAISDCKCVGGYRASTTACIQCQANTYNVASDPVGTETTCDNCTNGKFAPVGSDALSDCTYRSQMYGYATLVNSSTSTSCTSSCSCNNECIRWHGDLSEGFDWDHRNDVDNQGFDILDATGDDSVLCGLLKSDGKLIKQQGC